MKTLHTLALLAGCSGGLFADDLFTNYLRQFHVPSGVDWDASSTVATSGSRLSDLAINPGGARFELWTIKSSPLAEHFLASTYVGSYVPLGEVVVRSADPFSTPPRTRADQPFYVDVKVEGLLSGAADPEAAKSVKFTRHGQSFGPDGNGIGLDRTQAILHTQTLISTNGEQTLTFTDKAVPGGEFLKLRGEETFSVFTLSDTRSSGGVDYNVGETRIDSGTIQIWPVADGGISGVTQGQMIRASMPQVTLTLNDLYPSSRTYAQIYPGMPALNTDGDVVVGSVRNVSNSVPESHTLVLKPRDLDIVIKTDGVWTIELLTETPFGLERMRDSAGNVCAVWFNVDRTIKINGTFTTIE